MEVIQPEVPGTVDITPGGRLRSGSKITIDGCPSVDCSRFAINLKLGPKDEHGIAFHINPRFDNVKGKSYVVRNTLTVENLWGNEENRAGIFPFKQGEIYRVEINCEDRRFTVKVNGESLTAYTYRVPLRAITHIGIEGETQVSLIVTSGTVKEPACSTSSEHNTENNLSGLNDEFAHFGLSLAEKLRKLPSKKASYAQKIIMSMMFEIESLPNSEENSNDE